MSEAAEERFQSIDAVRGVAVLGILLMNIVGMGLPAFAYLDPSYYGGHTGADLWTWAVNNVFTDGKMRSLFTMLFGASTVLIASRAEGKSPGPWQTHYSRMFWLLVIGVIHAYFLWWGDILVCYAIAGLFIFPFRKLNALVQIGVGVAILVALMAFLVWQDSQIRELYAAVHGPHPAAALMAQWNEMSIMVAPPAALAQQEIAQFTGGFSSALGARAFLAQIMQFGFLPTDGIPEAIGQMFIGMGLFRLGFFTLKWSNRAYGTMIAVGYLIAAPVTAWLAWRIWQSGFDPMVRQSLMTWQGATRTLIALAHASVLLLIIRAGWIQALVNRLAAAGRMAFSNYLMTSIITTLVFTSPGLALYGHFSRFGQLIVVAGVWAFILIWSKPWMERFHYGPFEWVWRSLVRLRPQPFVKGRTQPVAQPA